MSRSRENRSGDVPSAGMAHPAQQTVDQTLKATLASLLRLLCCIVLCKLSAQLHRYCIRAMAKQHMKQLHS